MPFVERKVSYKPFVLREFICTKEDPWSQEKCGDLRTTHPDAKCIGSEYGSLSDGGSYDKFICPYCGKYFKVELPD